tara:strand:- start:670 stop:861 length:192 start_codon:yes stop_codon:yes gene_type:complete
MLIYEFLERRFDQLLDCPEHGVADADYMVDALLNKNVIEFKQINHEVGDICLELWQINDDIPF